MRPALLRRDSAAPQSGMLSRGRFEPAPLASIRALTAELRAAADLDVDAAQHVSIRVIHGLCEAIARAERQAIAPARLKKALEPVHALHAESAFLARLQTWPRGYAGDFETIELICEAQTITEAPVARCLEWYALNCPIAQQHRNKIQRQAALIVQTVSQRADPEILLVGCGGCRDLFAAGSLALQHPAHFTLNDSDPGAIDFALARLPAALRLTREPGNALRVVPRLARLAPARRFDLVVAGGIFDYLPDAAAVLLLRAAWQSLAPGGTFFFTNIAASNPYRPWMEHVLDWKLIERTADDVQRLLETAGVPDGAAHFERDLTRLTHLIEVWRNG